MSRNYLVGIILVLLVTSSCNPQKRFARKRSAYMTANYKALKRTLVEAEVLKLRDTIKVIFPNHLLFATGSYTIMTSVNPLFVRFGNALNQYSMTNILINGHTDNTGNSAVNDKLSLDRAKSAKEKLVEQNVDAARLFTWGLGSKHPIQSNETEEGRAKNRRVEFIVLHNALPPAPKK